MFFKYYLNEIINQFISQKFPINSMRSCLSPSYSLSRSLPYNQYQEGTQENPHQPQTHIIGQNQANIQCYSNKQFLQTTFGYRSDYIEIFLKLSHEDKLKLYLLMEEEKQQGTMIDKESYKRILTIMMNNIQNKYSLHQNSNQKEPNIKSIDQKKEKEMENIISSIPFQQPKISTVLKDIKKWQEENNINKELEQTLQHDFIQQNKINRISKVILESAKFDYSDGMEDSVHTPSTNQMSQKQNLNIFDSMEVITIKKDIKLTKENQTKIDMQTVAMKQLLKNQQLSIQQKQIKSNVDQKSPQTSIPISQQNYQIKRQSYHQNGNSFKISNQQSNKLNQINISNNKVKANAVAIQHRLSVKNQQHYHPCIQTDNTHEKINQFQQNQDENINVVPNSLIRQSVINIQVSYDFSQQEQEDQWQEAIVMPSSPKTASTIGKQNKLVYCVQNSINPPKQYQVSVNRMNPVQSNIFLQMNEEMSVLYVSNASNNDNPTKLDETQFRKDNFGNNISYPPKLLPIFAKMRCEQNPGIKIQSPTKNENKYSFLNHLKIQLSSRDKNYLKKQLKNQSFQCNSQFYTIIINYFKDLSIQESSQFQHFSKQLNIVKQISSLTEKYSKAVEEDQEEKVQAALWQSKQLYRQIFNNSHLTEEFVQRIMSNQFKQKGFLYKFGIILVNSNINKSLIEGIFKQKNHEDIQNSFYFLYILEKLNSLTQLKIRTENIIIYINYQSEKIKNFDQQKLRKVQEDIQKYPKFVEHIKDLLKICVVCERIIHLSKICCIKIEGNVMKTLKICKELKSRYLNYGQKQYDQLSISFTKYKDILKKGVRNNNSLDDIQAAFFEKVKKNPLCCICLKELRKWGGEVKGQNWFHYCCSNSIKQFQNTQINDI